MLRSTALLAALLLCACDDDEAPLPTLDASLDSSLLDARVPDASSDAYVPPAKPQTFSVRFDRMPSGETGGLAYTLSVDQDGRVEWFAGQCAQRPGAYTKQVPAGPVLHFYERLRASPYFTLPDRPSCDRPLLDADVSLWSVRVDGVEKNFNRYKGCLNLPLVSQVDALEQPLLGAAQLASTLVGDELNCYAHEDVRFVPAASYVLSREGTALAVLRTDPELGWTLEDCQGARIGAGGSFSARRYVVVDRERPRLRFGDGGLALASILITPDGDAGVTAMGLREDDDVPLTIAEGTSCTP